MNKKIVTLVCSLLLLTWSEQTIFAQVEFKQRNKRNALSQKPDSTIRTFEHHRITDAAKKKEGLFNVYKTIKGDYLLEIPDSLLNRDILFGSRISSISDNSRMSAGQRRSNPILISFVKEGRLLFMRQPSISSYGDSSIEAALKRNNVVPSAMTFDIIERNSKNDASIIDVTKFFGSEVSLVWPAGVTTGAGRLDPKMTNIVEMKAFPQNVEIKTFYNYVGGKEPFCVTIQYSFVLLPRVPYKMRFADARIGFSNESKRKYSSNAPVESQRIIDRWRIEPRHDELEKYKKGELVEPEKPIVFYVDTLMPAVWRKYVHQGIEQWNVAFEKIGFKNVIKTIDYPKDSSFDSDDSRYNCFKFVPSSEANAQGAQWIDPRSGEIVQGEILWWHSVIDKLRTWLFVQTAAADASVRAHDIPEEILGASIRYATAHEMGHVLGLQHNMRGSYAYPTDSLRSASFTQRYGTTASIMDYARNNYVAQPGDKEKGVYLYPPMLGPYDYFAIQYGYKPILKAQTPEEEVPVLNTWFLEKKNDPMYIFAPATVSPVLPDPSAQSDALGNDLIKSAQYGISNLKYIVSNLIKWTLKPNDKLELLNERYDNVWKLYTRLTTLPLSYIGGAYVYQGTYGQHSEMSVPISKAKQQETISFLFEEMTSVMNWVEPKAIQSLIGSNNDNIVKWQSELLDGMLGNFILPRILEYQSKTHYTPDAYLHDIDNAIWKYTMHSSLSNSDKNIQLRYVQNLIALVTKIKTSNDKNYSDNVWASAAYTQLLSISQHLSSVINSSNNNKAHYLLLQKMIKNAL